MLKSEPRDHLKKHTEIIKMPYSSKSSQKLHFQLQLSKLIIVKLGEVLLTSLAENLTISLLLVLRSLKQHRIVQISHAIKDAIRI